MVCYTATDDLGIMADQKGMGTCFLKLPVKFFLSFRQGVGCWGAGKMGPWHWLSGLGVVAWALYLSFLPITWLTRGVNGAINCPLPSFLPPSVRRGLLTGLRAQPCAEWPNQYLPLSQLLGAVSVSFIVQNDCIEDNCK